MNSKLIGFILSPKKINYTPRLNKNTLIKTIILPLGTLSLYYYGDFNSIKISDNAYSMAFPATNNLLDHNLIVTILDDKVIIENDWLGSIPIFYNTTEKIVSSFPNICLKNNKQTDKDGLFNFLSYGFSVYEKTPFKEVKFLPFYSKLTYTSTQIFTHAKNDPVKNINDYNGFSESEIWQDISNYSLNKENATTGKIIIPTSAGYDSRIINYHINQKDRVENYSYGISSNQQKSFEVIEAQKLAKTLGHQWGQIHLLKAYDKINAWHDLYGYSTHLHGMYHIEFFEKIKDLLPNQQLSMVSGICGGVFTGSNEYKSVKTPKDLYDLAFTHGLNYQIKEKQDYPLEKQFLEKYDYLFSDIRLYPVITMRIKLMLLSYLMTIPSVMGIPSWTPFLNFDIVMKMLNLPAERRKNRLWVREFFESKGLSPHKSMLFHDTKNRLNFNLHNNYTFEPIADNFPMPFINKQRVEEINHFLGNMGLKSQLNYKLTTTRVVKEVLKKVGITNQFSDKLTDYQTIKALEMSLLQD